MKISFGQIFYGVGSRGYAVLAASPLAKGLEDEATSLCGIVGTPRVVLDGSPVLASCPVGDSVLLARACAGPLDPNGRRSLFFHVLTARAGDLAASGLDAFSLSEKGMFKSALPADSGSDVELDVEPGAFGAPPPPFSVSFPCVLRLAAPNAPLVRSLLGVRVNSLTWASFAEMASQRFDCCTVDQYAALPPGLPIYNDKGLVRGASPSPADTDEPEPQQESSAVKEKVTSSGALKASILLNVVLAAACVVLWAGRGRHPPTEQVRPADSTADATAADKEQDGELESLRREAAEFAKFKELFNGFARDSLMPDWDAVVADSTYLSQMKKPVNPEFQDQQAVYRKITANVKLVTDIFRFYSKGDADR